LQAVADTHFFNEDDDPSQSLAPAFKSPTFSGDSIYEPLRKEENEIRLIRIHPSNDQNARIECSIVNAMLTDSLRFTALSYVWGDANVTEEITVNESPFAVSTNLASALRHVRATDVRVVMDAVWVDAICINQNDILEKNHQVRLMGSIYSSATLVVGWLGPETDDSARALDLVYRISRAYQAAKARSDHGYEWLKALPEIWRSPETEI
jgi:hypothetical protein